MQRVQLLSMPFDEAPIRAEGAVVRYDPEVTLADVTYSIPNGAWLAGAPRQRAAQMARLKRQGLKKGVFDIFCMLPTKTNGKPMYLELKRDATQKLTADQEEFKDIAMKLGYVTEVAHSLEEAVKCFQVHYGVRRGIL